MGNLKRILIGAIAVLVLIVILFSYFTFSEDSKNKNYSNIQNILKNDNINKETSSSSGKFSFIIKNKINISSKDISHCYSEESIDYYETSVDSSTEKTVVSLSSENLYLSSSALENDISSSSVNDGKIPIIGNSVLTFDQLYSFAKSKEKEMKLTCSLNQLINLYLSIGSEYGVRGDIAFLQAIIETGWFKFNRPSSYKIKEIDGTTTVVNEPRPEGLYVVPSDNNFCGLGVTGYIGSENSVCRFKTAALGVEAQIQHLYAYACKDSIPVGKVIIDPRFKYVSRGCAPTWNELGNGKWAADESYSKKILELFKKVLA